MQEDVVVLVVEDDEGHARLIERNLVRAGVVNRLLHFRDGQEILDFLFQNNENSYREQGAAYLLLLDIRMPRVDGVEVLERIKKDPELCKIPTIMITTTDDPREIETCHTLGCSSYITKPLDYDKFVTAIRQLGLFLSVVQIPTINGIINE